MGLGRLCSRPLRQHVVRLQPRQVEDGAVFGGSAAKNSTILQVGAKLRTLQSPWGMVFVRCFGSAETTDKHHSPF
jgi:hypothetical protein